MKIGFDAKRLFHNKTGLGNYARTLIRNLSNFHPQEELFLYSPTVGKNEFAQEFSNDTYQVRTANGKNGVVWRSFGIKQPIQNDNLDVFHGLSHEIPRNIRSLECKKIVTIHDLIYKIHPEFFPLFDRTVYSAKVNHSIQNSDVIIAVSNSTKIDILTQFNVPESKIVVIPPALTAHYYSHPKPAKNLKQPFNLFVGSIEPRKNLLRLIDAYALLPNDLKIPLYLVGNGGKHVDKINSRIKKHKLEKIISIKNGITDKELQEYYHQATLFIYPSLYEGFGLPISEALMSKTPVIASNISSMPEAGGPGTKFIDPYNVDSIASTIREVLSDETLQAKMAKDGYEYVREILDPERTTNKILEVYKQ